MSDLGFCGPVDKPSESIYGKLPYIAPEVLSEKKTTKESDVYSIGMLMWEISSGQPPFNNYEHDYYLSSNIINGIRPKIISGTPLDYESLMKQCWDTDPTKRPNVNVLSNEILELRHLYQNEKLNSIEINEINIFKPNYKSSRLFTSKIYQFENFLEPR